MTELPPLPEPDLHEGITLRDGGKYAGTEDGYTAESVRSIVAAAVAKERESAKPMSMALCESHAVVLRVGVPYVFRPVGDCQTCAKMFAQAVEAYGPTGGEPTPATPQPPAAPSLDLQW